MDAAAEFAAKGSKRKQRKQKQHREKRHRGETEQNRASSVSANLYEIGGREQSGLLVKLFRLEEHESFPVIVEFLNNGLHGRSCSSFFLLGRRGCDAFLGKGVVGTFLVLFPGPVWLFDVTQQEKNKRFISAFSFFCRFIGFLETF